MVEALLQDEARALTRVLIQRAMAGHAVPLQLVFERLAPPRKDRHVHIELPPIASLQDVLVAQGAIIRSAAAGKLTPSEAQAMAGLLELRRRTLEAVDLEARLTALEAQLGHRSSP